MQGIRWFIFGLAVTLRGLTPAHSAHAQISGRVTAHDAALSDAAIELWSSTAMLAARRTDSDGRFTFTAAEVSGATGVLARRLGFRPATFPVTGSQQPLAIELQEVAVPLR
jgi:hypothetical protein